MQEYRDVADSERRVGNRRERGQIGGTCVVLKLPIARTTLILSKHLLCVCYIHMGLCDSKMTKNLLCLY